MSEPSVDFEVDREQGFLWIRVRGSFTLEQAKMARAKAIESHPDLNRLYDFREADLTSWTQSDMRTFILMVNKQNPSSADTRVAALVARDVEFGIARMYEMMCGGLLGVAHAVFREEEKAVAWICRNGLKRR